MKKLMLLAGVAALAVMCAPLVTQADPISLTNDAIVELTDAPGLGKRTTPADSEPPASASVWLVISTNPVDESRPSLRIDWANSGPVMSARYGRNRQRDGEVAECVERSVRRQRQGPRPPETGGEVRPGGDAQGSPPSGSGCSEKSLRGFVRSGLRHGAQVRQLRGAIGRPLALSLRKRNPRRSIHSSGDSSFCEPCSSLRLRRSE